MSLSRRATPSGPTASGAAPRPNVVSLRSSLPLARPQLAPIRCGAARDCTLLPNSLDVRFCDCERPLRKLECRRRVQKLPERVTQFAGVATRAGFEPYVEMPLG
jgi:hypothetical protein